MRDGSQQHLAATWGGTLFNFGPNRPRLAAYAQSAARFRDIVAKAGADVMLSNHTVYDGSKTKLPARARRASRARRTRTWSATTSVQRYLTVANECAQAAIWRSLPRQ